MSRLTKTLIVGAASLAAAYTGDIADIAKRMTFSSEPAVAESSIALSELGFGTAAGEDGELLSVVEYNDRTTPFYRGVIGPQLGGLDYIWENANQKELADFVWEAMDTAQRDVFIQDAITTMKQPTLESYLSPEQKRGIFLNDWYGLAPEKKEQMIGEAWPATTKKFRYDKTFGVLDDVKKELYSSLEGTK